jgi:hypothetical protein
MIPSKEEIFTTHCDWSEFIFHQVIVDFNSAIFTKIVKVLPMIEPI